MVTKKYINDNTVCTKIQNSDFHRFSFEHEGETYYTDGGCNFYIDGKHSFLKYGWACYKKDFVDKVYEFIGG